MIGIGVDAIFYIAGAFVGVVFANGLMTVRDRLMPRAKSWFNKTT